LDFVIEPKSNPNQGRAIGEKKEKWMDFPPHLGILPWGVGSRGGKGKVAQGQKMGGVEAAHRAAEQEEAAPRGNVRERRG
jgi:hypothetical protein